MDQRSSYWRDLVFTDLKQLNLRDGWLELRQLVQTYVVRREHFNYHNLGRTCVLPIINL